MTFCDAPHRHDCQTSSTESKTGTLLATQNEQGRTSYLLDQARPIASRLFIHEIVDRNLGCESKLTSRDFCGRSPQSPTLQTPSAASREGQESFAMHHIASAAKPHPWSRRKEPWLQAKLASRNFLSARLGATHCLHVVHPRIEDRSLGCTTSPRLANVIHRVEDRNFACNAKRARKDFVSARPGATHCLQVVHPRN